MNKTLLAFCLSVSVVAFAELQLVTKPAQAPAALPFFSQTEAFPEGAKADEFQETAPQVAPLPQEASLGMMLFQRPLTDPVWPNTRPQAFERVERLDDWGAQGQFVTLNFAVYPLAELKNLTVQVTDAKVMPEVRLVRYWNIIYPFYNSYSLSKERLYRRMPEFLMPVTRCDAPQGEPQRFYLTFQLPTDGTTELTGNVLVYHDGLEQAVQLPFRIQVLPFQLKQDPAKNYSAYYRHVRHKDKSEFFAKNSANKELVRKTQLAEFRRMLEYGFTRLPTLYMSYGSLPGGIQNAFYIPGFDEVLEDMRTAGFDMNSPLPVVGSSYMYLYQKHTGEKLKSFHMENMDCSKIPQALYDDVDQALEKFLKYAEARQCPPMIFNPIDEPSLAALPFVLNIYRIFKKHNLKTFMTSPPDELIRQGDELFDYYSYGKFLVPYEKAVSGDKAEYWCYPNDVAFQKKDPVAMCHGGRMTYGLGFWRRGYHVVMPWIWSVGTSKRLCNAGGNLMNPDTGELYMTTYWECFRLGVDDLRYVYTLEDTVVRRENTTDDGLLALLKSARALLQRAWDWTCPLPIHMRENLMPHAEIDALRAEMATMILKLRAYPENKDAVASSVIVEPRGDYDWPQSIPDSPNVVFQPLVKWLPSAKETTLTETPGLVDMRVAVDHLSGEGAYLCGWPSIRHNFTAVEKDLTRYSMLEFDLTVSSDRDAQADYQWPINVVFASASGQKMEYRIVNTLEPQVSHHFTIPVSQLTIFNQEQLKNMAYFQVFISESNYQHGSNLDMQFANVQLVGFSQPTILKVDAPREIAVPMANFSVPVAVGGVMEGVDCLVQMALEKQSGEVLDTCAIPVVQGNAVCGFKVQELAPGEYLLRTELRDQKGSVLDAHTNALTVIPLP